MNISNSLLEELGFLPYPNIWQKAIRNISHTLYFLEVKEIANSYERGSGFEYNLEATLYLKDNTRMTIILGPIRTKQDLEEKGLIIATMYSALNCIPDIYNN